MQYVFKYVSLYYMPHEINARCFKLLHVINSRKICYGMHNDS